VVFSEVELAASLQERDATAIPPLITSLCMRLKPGLGHATTTTYEPTFQPFRATIPDAIHSGPASSPSSCLGAPGC